MPAPRRVFADRLRQVTLLIGSIAAFGIAEQHHDPAPLIAVIPLAHWPTTAWNVWTVWNLAAGAACLATFALWHRRSTPMLTVTAAVYATGIWARSLALFAEYGLDLWGTVARNALNALLIVSLWPWSGRIGQIVDRARVEVDR